MDCKNLNTPDFNNLFSTDYENPSSTDFQNSSSNNDEDHIEMQKLKNSEWDEIRASSTGSFFPWVASIFYYFFVGPTFAHHSFNLSNSTTPVQGS
jgi:hypothetical protein